MTCQRNNNWLPLATRNPACNPGLCLTRNRTGELFGVRDTLQPKEPHQLGQKGCTLDWPVREVPLRGDSLVEDLQERHSSQNVECKGPEAGARSVSWRSSVRTGQSEEMRSGRSGQGLVSHSKESGVFPNTRVGSGKWRGPNYLP